MNIDDYFRQKRVNRENIFEIYLTFHRRFLFYRYVILFSKIMDKFKLYVLTYVTFI